MQPTGAQYDVMAGFDVTSVTTLSKSQIAQAINQITPLSNTGFVLCFNSNSGQYWPGTGTNPRYKRFLWLDLYDGSLRRHDQTAGNNYVNWVPVTGGVAAVNISAVTSSWTLPTALPWNLAVAHNLGYVPRIIRPVLYCDSDDAGYLSGDEIDFYTGYFIAGAAGFPMANIVPDANNINIIFAAGYTERRIFHRTTGDITTIDNAKWKIKFYLIQ